MNKNNDFKKPPVISKLFIDKVFATLNIDTSNLTNISKIKLAFEHIKNEEGFKQVKKNDYMVTLSGNDNTYGKDGDMLLQHTPKTNENNNYLRFVFNPSKNNMGNFRKLIDMIVPEGGYGRFINNAKLNRMDFTIDIGGLPITDLLMSYPRMGIRKVISKSKSLEYLQMGSEPTQIVAYDKNAHLKHLNKR